ncbi:MAG TPA: DUF4232 domain-containing protein [Jatrophihabitans sp.]|jgi:hypothetical protein|nr:DUF4232 domain-containing protein [Jatrophihabitans sp.]
MKTISLATATALAAAGCVLAVPTAASATPACGNHSLAVTATASQGATGHGNFVLLFRNKTYRACTLYGYPGLDALNGYGNVIKHAKRTLTGFTGGSTQGLQTIRVKPGKYASADVEWLNFKPKTGESCTFSASVAATPANTSHTVHLNRSVSVCRLEVHPTVAGKTGNS